MKVCGLLVTALLIAAPLAQERGPVAATPEQIQDAIGKLGARLVSSGHKVLSHCALGFNRSALVAGLILRYMGLNGEQALAHLRARRPGALFNDAFASYLLTCETEPA